MTEKLQLAFERVSQLPDEQQDAIAERILRELADEGEWEAAVLQEALAGALRPDGTIDFEQLRRSGLHVAFSDLLLDR